jgi:hypothetical protein
VSRAFTALLTEDENFEIVSTPKKRLDWTLIENIWGYRKIYAIRVQQITEADRDFLFGFIQSVTQYITINGVSTIEVYLRDKELLLDLLNGYSGNLVLNMEFEDRALTVIAEPARTSGVTTSSVGYKSATEGVTVTLGYNYGKDGKDITKRVFRVKSVSSNKADIEDIRWEYIDKNNGYKRLGFRLNFEIDFGTFGISQSQTELFDDRTWIKEFILAPSKRIEVFGQYIADVVNDFDVVEWSYNGGNIFSRTIKLNFKQRFLGTGQPLKPEEQFILDSPTSGILNSNTLG